MIQMKSLKEKFPIKTSLMTPHEVSPFSYNVASVHKLEPILSVKDESDVVKRLQCHLMGNGGRRDEWRKGIRRTLEGARMLTYIRRQIVK